MNLSAQIAKQFRNIHFAGNCTSSGLKDNVAGIAWQQATTPVGSFNTIAALVYHMHYYVDAVLKVLRGGQLNAIDTLSFSHSPIQWPYDGD